jgi:uncharacterized protein YbgA (DUF1722 family)/uncharacterized protein YbbK (DUF523 family)
MTETNDDAIRIGISACLLGKKVRYDGGHKQDRFLTDTLGQYFSWVSVCPEVEFGLGTPRPTIRLERRGEKIHLIMPSEQRDITKGMQTWSHQRTKALTHDDLCGFVLKNRSPSCGMERVKVHPEKQGPSRKDGRGVFAEALLKQFPNLPIEEEGRLCDPRLRENWITRVFAYHRVTRLWQSRWTIGDLVAFHTAHKYLLLAHSPQTYRDLGRLVAAAKQHPRNKLKAIYERELMEGLKKIATAAKNTNVMQHMAGYFKKQWDSPSRRELLSLITDYREGFVPLIVPLTLIAHYVRIFDVEYLRGQVYLNPHPKELALRNHV